MNLLQAIPVDPTDIISRGFEISPLIGFMAIFQLLLVIGLVYSEKRRRISEDKFIEVIEKGHRLLTLVESKFDKQEKLTEAVNGLKELIQQLMHK